MSCRMGCVDGLDTALYAAVGSPTDFSVSQWQAIARFTRRFTPDLILELGRGYGNSTCMFTSVANRLPSCRVVSVSLGNGWERTLPRIEPLVPRGWLDCLDVIEADITAFDFAPVLRDAKRPLVFLDAHGFDVAETLLARTLPIVAGTPARVVAHDMGLPRKARRRYQGPLNRAKTGGGPLWLAPDFATNSGTEEAIALLDFTSRNGIPFHKERGWCWFALEDATLPLTFPHLS